MTLAQQRRYDTWAAGLLFFGSIVATGINYFTKQGFWRPALTHKGLIILLLSQPFYLVWVYLIWKGKRWAKILYVVISALGLVAFLFLPTPANLVTDSLVGRINVVAQNILAFSVSALLIVSLRRPTPDTIE
jgi:hypothetical protein